MTLLIDSLPVNCQPLGEMEIVELSFAERSKTRQRCLTNLGRELTLLLPRGTVLSEGVLLYNTQETTIVVKARPEPVLVVEAESAKEICMLAYQLGNWHRSLQFEGENRILSQPDAPLENWLKRSQIAYRLETRPYHPNLQGHQH